MRLFLAVAIACVGVSDCRVSHLLLVAGVVAAQVPWISSLLILDKLKGEGYRYSNIFGPSLFLRYWQVAPERGWSRLPIFMLTFGGALGGLLFLLGLTK